MLEVQGSAGSNPTGSTITDMWRNWQTRRVQGAFSAGSNPAMSTIKGRVTLKARERPRKPPVRAARFQWGFEIPLFRHLRSGKPKGKAGGRKPPSKGRKVPVGFRDPPAPPFRRNNPKGKGAVLKTASTGRKVPVGFRDPLSPPIF